MGLRTCPPGRRLVRLRRTYGNNVAGEVCSFPLEEVDELIRHGLAEALDVPPPTPPETPKAKAKHLAGPPAKTALNGAPKEK